MGAFDTNEAALRTKEKHLSQLLRGFESVIVAFSGGIDSSLLAFVANRELGDRSLAVTGVSPSYPASHKQMVSDLTSRFGIRHRIIHTDEFNDASYTSNPANRCYYCKSELYSKLGLLAVEEEFKAICDGTNADDAGDHRPGRLAAREMGVRAPLMECGLGKSDIRELARREGLPNWDEPASACLSSRIPYGQIVTIEKVSMVDKAETALRRMGFRQVRVRHHGDVARIELGESDLARALNPELARDILSAVKSLGFKYVALDLEGYRSGSLNEVLTKD